MKLSRRKIAVIKDSQQPASIWGSGVAEVETRPNTAGNEKCQEQNSTDTKYDLILPMKRFQRRKADSRIINVMIE